MNGQRRKSRSRVRGPNTQSKPPQRQSLRLQGISAPEFTPKDQEENSEDLVLSDADSSAQNTVDLDTSDNSNTSEDGTEEILQQQAPPQIDPSLASHDAIFVGNALSTNVTSDAEEEEEMAAKCTLPPFWPTKPELWFLRAESVMTTQKVTDDDEKFNLIVGCLDSETIDDVNDTIATPPEQDKYDALKKAIIKRTSASAEKRLQEVLSGMSLGDSKPSQLWRKLKQRAGTHIDDDALKVRWLDLLPSNISMLLKIVESKDMNKVSDTADQLLEINGGVMAVGPTRSYTPPPTPNNLDLAQEIAQLKAAASQLSALVLQNQPIFGQQQQQFQQHQHRARSRSRNRSRATSPGAQGWCWYHQKHGANAVRCTHPCTFTASPTPPGN